MLNVYGHSMSSESSGLGWPSMRKLRPSGESVTVKTVLNGKISIVTAV